MFGENEKGVLGLDLKESKQKKSNINRINKVFGLHLFELLSVISGFLQTSQIKLKTFKDPSLICFTRCMEFTHFSNNGRLITADKHSSPKH